MPTYYDSQNQPHVLAERLGSGGEGTVYSCEADGNVVAKIYHEPVSDAKAEKLRWMAANKNERLLRVAAWVVDVLRDAPGGRVVGFLMPNIKAKEIHELYSLKSRRVYFPDATWHFLVHTATNVARAFYNLHGSAHIMGDVNHGNCVVMRDGTVKLIDCDSYSIKTDKERYRCEVGVATHLAPELQGANLRDVEREDKHDNFGLAVIIFQLLFLGRHPFAGNYLGDEDKSLEDCIRELRFAYGSNAELKNVRQPPGTLPLAAVSPPVALLFERAFLTEERPEPREWIEALEDLAQNLEQCGLHPGHFFFKKLSDCPWCEIEAQTGLMLFPFVASANHQNGEKPFNVFTVENLIASLGIQNNLPVKPPLSPDAVLPPPSPEIVEAKRSQLRLTFFVIPAHFLGLIVLMWVFGVGAAFYFGIMLLIFSIVFLNNFYKSTLEPLTETLADNERKWKKIESERTQDGVPQIINDDLIKIRKKLADYQSAQRRSVGEMKLLQAEAINRELHKFLRSKTTANAEIAGLAAGERKKIIASGVKTAAEIDENRLRHFYKITDETIPSLLEWRARLLLDFDKDEQAREIVKVEQTHFVAETDRERRRIERDIEQLLILLRAGAVHLQKQQRRLYTKSEAVAKQISQAKSDLQTFGSNLPATVGLILITVFTPAFSLLNEQRTPRYSAPRYPQTMDLDSYPNMAPDKTLRTDPKYDSYLPDEDMTDAVINSLPDAMRNSYAENLYNEAVTYNYEQIDRAKAEKYSRQAVRFVAAPRFFNQLGYALYGQEKYAESLNYLNRSLTFEKGNSETKIFISMNYLALKRYSAAAGIMKEVTGDYPNLYEGFYSLGLAYNGLKDFARAADAFGQAAKIKPSDADTHYQLGYCFYKLKKSVELRREYDDLLKLNEETARDLKAETKLDTDSIIKPKISQ